MRKVAISSICVMITIGGCVSAGTNVTQDQLSHFQKGVTTDADVIKVLGPAQSTARGSDGTESLVYAWNSAHAKAATFIPVVGLFAGGATGQATTVVFKFDTLGKLDSYTSSSSNVDVHTGITGTSVSAAPAARN